MKFFKNKYILSLIAFFIFFTTAFFILQNSIPDKAITTKPSSEDEWIPKPFRWITSSKQNDTAQVTKNNSKKVSGDSDIFKHSATVYLGGIIPVKTVNLSFADEIRVIPGGDSIGIDLKTRGLLVVGVEEFTDISGSVVSPGFDAGIKKGDIIEKLNGITVSKANSVQDIIKNSNGEIICEGIRDGKTKEWKIQPGTDINGNERRIGIWLRESIAGVGTITYFCNNTFGALGHAISDVDTGKEVSGQGGKICSATIIGVDKGEKGIPGALKGVFKDDHIGDIKINSNVGIFGNTEYVTTDSTPVSIATRKEIRPGKAQIICNIGDGKTAYDAEILKTFHHSTDTKSMVIHITDKELIEKTGGIVQGMSGSPLVQNGKLIGAVTHVFVNDPTRGYGIFIENMLAEAEKIK